MIEKKDMTRAQLIQFTLESLREMRSDYRFEHAKQIRSSWSVFTLDSRVCSLWRKFANLRFMKRTLALYVRVDYFHGWREYEFCDPKQFDIKLICNHLDCICKASEQENIPMDIGLCIKPCLPRSTWSPGSGLNETF